jgi:hypothetical protein
MPLEALLAVASEVLGGRPPRRAPAWLVRLMAPVVGELASWRLALSNERARRELGWAPRYPGVREGLGPLADRPTKAA